MKRYQYLLFDNDGTLMDFEKDQIAAFESAFLKFPCMRGRSYSPDYLTSYQQCNHRWWQKFDLGQCSKNQLQLGRFQDFLTETGLQDDPAVLNTLYMEALGKQNRLLDGALTLIQTLSRDYKILIITNGVAATQHSRLGASPLFPYLDGIFVSEDVGCGKPAKAYFDYVLQKAGIADKGRCLVIGDSLSSDIQGANNAGIDCCWFNPKGLENQGLAINFTVKTLDEIRCLLAD